MDIYNLPAWTNAYTANNKISKAQGLAAYSAYYGVDGSADQCGAVEELVAPAIPLLRPYASRTGTKSTLANMRKMGWSILLSAAGSLQFDRSFEWALDNGAWSAYQQGKEFDEYAFAKAVDKVAEGAQWVVLPDIVQGGMKSLDLTLRWMDRLKGLPTRTLIAVQDGMTPDDVRGYLGPMCGLFIGGSTAFKENMDAWGMLARRCNAYLHIGRVNTQRRIRACAQVGANSFDGTSIITFPDTIRPLTAGVAKGNAQSSLFNPRAFELNDVPYDCGW